MIARPKPRPAPPAQASPEPPARAAIAAGLFRIAQQASSAEALEVFARKLNAARTARNACSELVILAEQRIGRELKAAQERGELATRADGTTIRDHVPQGNKVVPATIAEIGLSRKQAMHAKRLADVPEAAIKAEIAAANAEDRPASRARILAAAPPPAPAPMPTPAGPKPSPGRGAWPDDRKRASRIRREYSALIQSVAAIASAGPDLSALVATAGNNRDDDLREALTARMALARWIEALKASGAAAS